MGVATCSELLARQGAEVGEHGGFEGSASRSRSLIVWAVDDGYESGPVVDDFGAGDVLPSGGIFLVERPRVQVRDKKVRAGAPEVLPQATRRVDNTIPIEIFCPLIKVQNRPGYVKRERKN